MDKHILALPLFCASLLACKNCTANDDPFDDKTSYLPYVQVGGTRFFNVKSSAWATSADLFVPVFQQPTNLVFLDARIYDRTGRPFEGNIHLGYRHLVPDNEQLYGIYAAFDRKRTNLGNYFNQITLGGEFWWNKLFLGCNIYQPVGTTSKLTEITESVELKKVSNNLYNVWITDNRKYEKAMGGGDIEAGYEIINGLVGYVGGYYFKTKDVQSMVGPKAKLTYDWSLENGKRIVGIFDKLGLEAGVQHDKPRGTVGYLSLNFRIGLLPNKTANHQGVSRHMVDLVRRDVDINSAQIQTPIKKKILQVTIMDDPNLETILKTVEEEGGPNNIVVKSSYNSPYYLEITILDKNHAPVKTLTIGSNFDIASDSGQFYNITVPDTGQSSNQLAPLFNLHQSLVEKVNNNVAISVGLDSFKGGLSAL